MTYSINITGSGVPNPEVQAAFEYAVRSLRAHTTDESTVSGSANGSNDGESFTVNASDVTDEPTDESEPDTASPETVNPAAGTATGENVNEADGSLGTPGGQTFGAGDAQASGVATEPVVYDANDPDNPANSGNAG